MIKQNVCHTRLEETFIYFGIASCSLLTIFTAYGTMADFPCGVCKIDCEIDVIQCSNCEFWFHIQCISMTKSDLKVWSSPQLHFFCRNCSYVGDEYNAEKALDR